MGNEQVLNASGIHKPPSTDSDRVGGYESEECAATDVIQEEHGRIYPM